MAFSSVSFSYVVFILFPRVEQSVYALLRTRDMAVSRYKEFGIPVDWLSDSGVVGKVWFEAEKKTNLVIINRFVY